MRVLSTDIETYSSRDLAKCGVHPYTQAEDFEILLFGYSIDGGGVRVIDLKSGEKLPDEVLNGLCDRGVLKTAFNAGFERTCINVWFGLDIPADEWCCSQVMALGLGLPGSLKEVGRCLGLKDQKLDAGASLVLHFCRPHRINDQMTRYLPDDDRTKWEEFKAYCKRVVEVEVSIRDHLLKYSVTAFERELWCLDQRINDRGVMVDRGHIQRAIMLDAKNRKVLTNEGAVLTGLDNPNSTQQLRGWLKGHGICADSLSKEAVDDLLGTVCDYGVKRVLEIRRELSKTSIKKYEAMENALCSDGRIRGLFQFYGASRTGRWAGRLVQVHNLPRISMDNVDVAREMFLSGGEGFDMFFESVPEVLSQLIRTAFIPDTGSRFIISDYSAIEARIIAWLAGESWRMGVFKTHGKIYEASAARMFNVPVESIEKSSPLRQRGKIAELALGYQGGRGALVKMGALKMGLSEEELDELVRAWRASNPNIVRLWRDVENAAIGALESGSPVRIQGGIEFFVEPGVLFVRLPSGRCLSYINPQLDMDEAYAKKALSYDGTTGGTGKWGRQNTYGGKLVENIVQAIARDCLGEAMMRLDGQGIAL